MYKQWQSGLHEVAVFSSILFLSSLALIVHTTTLAAHSHGVCHSVPNGRVLFPSLLLPAMLFSSSFCLYALPE